MWSWEYYYILFSACDENRDRHTKYLVEHNGLLFREVAYSKKGILKSFPRLSNDLFLPNPFQSIVYRPSYHMTLYCIVPDVYSVVKCTTCTYKLYHKLSNYSLLCIHWTSRLQFWYIRQLSSCHNDGDLSHLCRSKEAIILKKVTLSTNMAAIFWAFKVKIQLIPNLGVSYRVY
jgi:hypothetical protein